MDQVVVVFLAWPRPPGHASWLMKFNISISPWLAVSNMLRSQVGTEEDDLLMAKGAPIWRMTHRKRCQHASPPLSRAPIGPAHERGRTPPFFFILRFFFLGCFWKNCWYLFYPSVLGYVACNEGENILTWERFLQPRISFGVPMERMLGGEESTHMDMVCFFSKKNSFMVFPNAKLGSWFLTSSLQCFL